MLGELVYLPRTNASVAELEYARGLEPRGETLTGSNPVRGIGTGRVRPVTISRRS